MKYFMTQFHVFIFPSLVIFLIIFALYMFGNALRDALDPRLRNEDFVIRRFRREKRRHRAERRVRA